MNPPLSFLFPFRRSVPAAPRLQDFITGQILTGIWLENDNLYLCFAGKKVMNLHLNSRECTEGGRGSDEPWLIFPGWLTVQRVIQDAAQVILVVSALYSGRICIRKTQGHWRIIFQGGRDLAA